MGANDQTEVISGRRSPSASKSVESLVEEMRSTLSGFVMGAAGAVVWALAAAGEARSAAGISASFRSRRSMECVRLRPGAEVAAAARGRVSRGVGLEVAVVPSARSETRAAVDVASRVAPHSADNFVRKKKFMKTAK